MSALTKADLVEHLHQIMGLNKREAKDLIEIFFEQVAIALKTGKHVKISGFGNFELRDKRERPGRNPKTGEEVPVSARRVVTFKPSQKLKAKVESYFGPKANVNEEQQAS
ncbi:MAG: integration host factor subunit alpha [Gammaproteobacteria bacterium RIFCSPHIGHO2_12_FULL_35_23]|nr:MAG: integration host factor subunit alpha [Gammaproteobacteria bacterium RIFCSPHIGHO2_12_FULL_35_23]